MKIKTATLEDVIEIKTIWEDVNLTRPWNNVEDDIKNALSTKTSTILLLCINDKIIGTVMVGYDGHRGWIYYLAVKNEFQKNGYGKILLNEAENWLRLQSVPKLNLMIKNTTKL